jgi:hypothetical protein
MLQCYAYKPAARSLLDDTGTLVAVMLSRLYGLSYTHALRHTQAYHDSRVYPQGVRSPQTAVQRAQVGV